MLTVGLNLPTCTFEMMSRSSMMLIKNLVELIISGMSGLSSALVLVATAVSIADNKAEKAEMRMYVTDAARTLTGTKPAANCLAAATKMTDMIKPMTDWKIIKVSYRLYLAARVRLALSPMTFHDARGSPSFRISATTPM